MRKKFEKTKLKIEEVLVELQNWSDKIYWVNKEHFKILQIYEGQFFMKNNWTIWILEWLKEKIKIVPWIKYIRVYL